MELKQEGKISVIDQESTLQEELFAVHIELTGDEKLLNIVNVHSLGGQQPLTDDVKAMLQGENGEIQLPEGEIPIPDKFDENVVFGKSKPKATAKGNYLKLLVGKTYHIY